MDTSSQVIWLWALGVLVFYIPEIKFWPYNPIVIMLALGLAFFPTIALVVYALFVVYRVINKVGY